MDLTDPAEAALRIAEVFAANGESHALYGGLLLAAYGDPRETVDVDLAVGHADVHRAAEMLRDAGLEAGPVFEPLRFGGLLLGRVELFGGREDRGLNVLDLVEPRSARYARAALGRAVSTELRGRHITVLGPEDFVVFKVLSSRDRDLEDAASVLRALAGDLDDVILETELQRLAVEIPDHPILERWSKLRPPA
jgi:hypothetical protein